MSQNSTCTSNRIDEHTNPKRAEALKVKEKITEIFK
jgi:hypothetical protein